MVYAEQAQAGTLVGHYQLLNQVGAGGMGVVFKAFDTRLQRTVALKFLISNSDLQDRHRLLREARSASCLDHKNIANIHAVEESADGEVFIVMAYYEGESLAERIRRDRFSPPQALPIIRQIAEGLEHAHLHQLIHRDIKPSNVILPVEGEAKIVDFGLSRFVSADASTQSRNLAGTLLYMSPEQVEGLGVDARTDIWSLGVVAYQLLTNSLPFTGESPAEVMRAILRRNPSINFVPDEWQLILQRALSKSVAARYHSCTELLGDLAAVEKLAGSAPTAYSAPALPERNSIPPTKRTSPVSKSTHPSWRLVLLSAVLLIAGTAAIAGWRLSLDQPLRSAVAHNTVAYETYLRGLELLERHDKSGNLDAAIRSFQDTTKADPKFALAFVKLGEAYWQKYLLDQDTRWIDAATAACKRAAELNDQLPGLYVTLGRIHDGTGKHELALQEFQRALDLDRGNAEALLGLAELYERSGRVQEAEETYNRAATMWPENWNGHYRLAIFYFKQRRFQDAVTQFRQVIERTADNAEAHSGLGISLAQLGVDTGAAGVQEEAEAELKKSISIQPTYFAYSNLGLLYYQQRRWPDAAAMWNTAVQLNKNDFRVWANLAMAYEWLDQRAQADNAYREELARLEPMAKLRPEDAALQCELGALYSRQQLRKKAISAVQAALARAPHDPDVLSCAGESYDRLGDRQQAIRLVKKAVSEGLATRDIEQNPNLRNLVADPKFRAAHGSP